MDFDFGYDGGYNSDEAASNEVNNNNDNKTNLDNNEIVNEVNGEEAENLDNTNSPVEGKDDSKESKESKESKDSEVKYEAGTVVEVDDKTYKFDDKGNLLDENGNIFKEAKDVADWIKGFENVQQEGLSTVSLEAIQKAIGITITDDKDKPVKFDNTVEGITDYVNAVIESSKQEHYDTAINTLYSRYPILEDVLNYYIANGNSLKGFGEVPDRSNITIDDSNEAQQESIIRTAWSEQGRRGDVESYIQYLKSSGTLLATAREELEALKESDAEYRKEMAAKAEEAEKKQDEALLKYWNGVHDVVKNRKIAGYEIPEQIIINRNGQKISTTPEDFFNYIYLVNKDGYSQYQLDLAKETPESRRDDEILRAYLKYVGGNYSNLVSMAINKEKVNTLRLKASERKTPKVRITAPAPANKKEIDLGYN